MFRNFFWLVALLDLIAQVLSVWISGLKSIDEHYHYYYGLQVFEGAIILIDPMSGEFELLVIDKPVWMRCCYCTLFDFFFKFDLIFSSIYFIRSIIQFWTIKIVEDSFFIIVLST